MRTVYDILKHNVVNCVYCRDYSILETKLIEYLIDNEYSKENIFRSVEMIPDFYSLIVNENRLT